MPASARRRRSPFALLVAATFGCALLSGCEDATPPAATPVPAATAAAPTPNATPVPAAITGVNDPSAPVDTPLCGTAARERSAIGQALLPRQYAEAGICRTFACYDPATATYLGADGYRHVCR
ncbi:MAG: BA14K family protein [Gluconacetobacter diazotrophicus]|nr:BA14K family protein [Gluconacetobacter diazotrophicus]